MNDMKLDTWTFSRYLNNVYPGTAKGRDQNQFLQVQQHLNSKNDALRGRLKEIKRDLHSSYGGHVHMTGTDNGNQKGGQFNSKTNTIL